MKYGFMAVLASIELALLSGQTIAGEASPAVGETPPVVRETPPSAEAKDESEGEKKSPFSGGFDLAIKNKSVWRGTLQTEDGVTQPTVYAGAYGFQAKFWGNNDLTDYGEEAGYGDHKGQFSEMDFIFSYGLALGPVNLEVGNWTYNFPNRLVERTSEIYGGVGLNLPLHPFARAYYDYREVDGTYFQVGIQEEFKFLKRDAFSLGIEGQAAAGFGTAGYNEDYFGVEENAANDFRLTVALPLWLNKHVKIAAIVEYTGLLEGEIRDAVDHPDNFIFGGSVGIHF